MQPKLDKFFQYTAKYDKNNKKCFIYDPDNKTAFFDYMPNDTTDNFITSKSGIKLFYRKPKQDNHMQIPTIKYDYSNVPLIISNLQKAIRRCDNEISMQSALTLIQIAPIKLLRRLPIIFIEDVCLMDTFSIVVWLMMAEKEYGQLKNTDIDILLNIVNSLCNCKKYYDYKAELYVNNKYSFTYNELQFSEGSNELLSLFYRIQYGGSEGDMQMMNVALDYYKNNPNEIIKTEYNAIDYNKLKELDILEVAIDFHCFPSMLNMLCNMTYIRKETIRMHIWFAESACNERKEETIDMSNRYKETNEWSKIEKYIEEVRYKLLE